MQRRGVEIELAAARGAERTDVELAEIEDAEELTDALEDAARRAEGTLVVDLRCSRRPAVALPVALDLAVAALARRSPALRLRALVESEAIAERLAQQLTGGEAGHRSEWRVGRFEVEVLTGDIVAIAADAVVNASNCSLKLGAGVSGALKRACGPGLQAEMNRHAPIEPGGLAVTGSHGLRAAPRIVHVATASGGADVVETALRKILEHAERNQLRSVAIPALGTGTGGLAMARAARIFREVIATYASTASRPLRVRIVLWSEADHRAFASELAEDARYSPA